MIVIARVEIVIARVEDVGATIALVASTWLKGKCIVSI